MRGIEIVGVVVGVAGLGIGAYALLRNRQQQATLPPPSGYNAGPPPGWNGSWGYSNQPPTTADVAPQWQQDASYVSGLVTSGINTVTNTISTFAQLFGGG